MEVAINALEIALPPAGSGTIPTWRYFHLRRMAGGNPRPTAFTHRCNVSFMHKHFLVYCSNEEKAGVMQRVFVNYYG